MAAMEDGVDLPSDGYSSSSEYDDFYSEDEETYSDQASQSSASREM